MRYNSITKYEHIVACEEYMDEQRCNGETLSVTIFVRATYVENRQRYWKDMLLNSERQILD